MTAPATRARCAIFRATPAGLAPPGLVGPGDEVLLLVELIGGADAGERPRALTVELWRGDRCRDRQSFQVELAADEHWARAFRPRWSDAPAGSSRLRCRVLLDGRERNTCQVLLGRPEVDNQGRFPPALGDFPVHA